MDFDQHKRPIIPATDVVAKLQRKVATQAKELSRLHEELRAVRNDLADIKDQRDRLRGRR